MEEKLKLKAKSEKALHSGYYFNTEEVPAFKNVFLIDDDEVANFINVELITQMDIAENIEVFTNGKFAYDYISAISDEEKNQTGRNLFLLDINMPEMNGFDFLEAYQQLHSPADVVIAVMLTTELNAEDKLKAQKLKNLVDVYIEKPLNKDILSGIVNFYSA